MDSQQNIKNKPFIYDYVYFLNYILAVLGSFVAAPTQTLCGV